MANLAKNTAIIANDGSTGSSHHAIFNFSLSDANQTDRYLHFKTTCPQRSNIMVMIEGVGFSYATSQPIRCAWTWYAYEDGVGGNSSLYAVSTKAIYNGMTPERVYVSGDGYVCFTTTPKNLYFVGVTFDTYNTAPNNGGGYDVTISQVGQMTTAGNFF